MKCRPYEKQPETGYGEYAQCNFGERWIRLAVYVQPAFGFFGGVPHKMVYDQDKVFPVNENLGDLVLTGGFPPLVREHGFDPVFCRKSDPKSKGKTENVVKYMKYGFLRGREFVDIDLLNKEAIGWLGRTGNGTEHHGIRRVPSKSSRRK